MSSESAQLGTTAWPWRAGVLLLGDGPWLDRLMRCTGQPMRSRPIGAGCGRIALLLIDLQAVPLDGGRPDTLVRLR